MDALLFSLALSTHIGLADDYNNYHPHVRFFEDEAIAGAYYNSVDNISFYAGARLEFGQAGIELAGVTGYPAFGPVAPYIRGTYDIGNGRLFIAPAYEENGEAVNVGLVAGIEFLIK